MILIKLSSSVRQYFISSVYTFCAQGRSNSSVFVCNLEGVYLLTNSDRGRFVTLLEAYKYLTIIFMISLPKIIGISSNDQ